MCIAILKTKKGKISDEALKESFTRNSDGAGIAYTLNKKLIIEKGIFNVEQFIKAVRRIEKICDNNMLIHCRIGTSGLKDKDNTHPFNVSKNVCLIHNGILDIDVPKNCNKNDTRLFIEKYLSGLNDKDLLHNNSIKKMIASLIGSNNKFVLMDNKGYYRIINEKAGHWKDDVWYSNTSYEPYYYSSANRYNYYYDWGWGDEYEDFNETKHPSAYEQAHLDIIEEGIKHLTVNEIINIGDYPVYDYEYCTLISEDEALKLNEIYPKRKMYYLADLSEELYWKYIEKQEMLENVA